MNLQPLEKVGPVVHAKGEDSIIAKRVNITNDEYHADKSAVSSTSLKEILRSPAHYYDVINNGREEKPAYRIGTAIHAYLLEYPRFMKEYMIAPKKGKSKASIAAYDEFVSAYSNCYFIDQDEMEMIERIAENVNKHPLARNLLQYGQSEQTFFWTDPETSILCKCRTDSLCSPFAILDVKSTLDASMDGFKRTIENLKYDFSAAMYQEGVFRALGEKLDFVWLAVEKNRPHGVSLYQCHEEDLEKGYRKFRNALQLLKSCRENNSYPGYQPDGHYQIIQTRNWYQ